MFSDSLYITKARMSFLSDMRALLADKVICSNIESHKSSKKIIMGRSCPTGYFTQQCRHLKAVGLSANRYAIRLGMPFAESDEDAVRLSV